MKRTLAIIFTAILIALLVIPAGATLAAEGTGVVAVTVQLAEVSISVSPDAVSYGMVSIGATDIVPETPADPLILAQNTGTCWVDMSIKGADTTGGWTLAGTPGVDDYVHYFAPGGVSYAPLTTDYQELGPFTSVSPDTILSFKLKMDTPTESASFEVQSTSVTVMATMVAEGITFTLETDAPTYVQGGGPAILTATVTDADDNPVTGIAAGKFLTHIEGSPQTVTFTETNPGVSGVYTGSLDISGLDPDTYSIGVFVSDDLDRAAFAQASIDITPP